MHTKLIHVSELLSIIAKHDAGTTLPLRKAPIMNSFDMLPVMLGHSRNFNDTFDLCERLELLETDSNYVKITKSGKKIANMYLFGCRLNERVKFLFREAFMRSSIYRIIHDALVEFTKTNDEVWHTAYGLCDLFTDWRILTPMYECDLFLKRADRVILYKDYNNHIKQYRMTQKELEHSLIRDKKIGDYAEQVVVDFEKKRLEGSGCFKEANMVKKISDVFVNAGYDIDSFNGESRDGRFDRHIEVKGTSNNNMEFYISKNELETAERLGESYWIYLVKNVDLDTNRSSEPECIQDPMRSISDKSLFKITPEKYRVKKLPKH